MKHSERRARGFSLVEVTMALGLMTFCLVALVGLLPIALNSMRSASQESLAINCLEQISGSVRRAMPVGQTSAYKAAGLYNSLTWTLGGSTVTTNFDNLSESGYPASVTADRKFTAHIVLTPPANLETPGTAQISVAWPPQAEWDSAAASWKNAEGAVSTWTIFLAKPSS